MNKELTPLQALEKLKKCYKNELKNVSYYNNLALKYKKALEIIKNKEVNVFIFLHSGDLETYNDMVEDNRKLTQEEYDLLKEVLL